MNDKRSQLWTTWSHAPVVGIMNDTVNDINTGAPDMTDKKSNLWTILWMKYSTGVWDEVINDIRIVVGRARHPSGQARHWSILKYFCQ